MHSPLFAFLPMGISGHEMIIFGVIALLLFGKRLPEVARSLGKGVTEFKRGLSGFERELTSTTSSRSNYVAPSRPIPDDVRLETKAPKFEPPTQAPVFANPEPDSTDTSAIEGGTPHTAESHD
jgi:sec-independent protein translocase protein TatA